MERSPARAYRLSAQRKARQVLELTTAEPRELYEAARWLRWAVDRSPTNSRRVPMYVPPTCCVVIPGVDATLIRQLGHAILQVIEGANARELFGQKRKGRPSNSEAFLLAAPTFHLLWIHRPSGEGKRTAADAVRSEDPKLAGLSDNRIAREMRPFFRPLMSHFAIRALTMACAPSRAASSASRKNSDPDWVAYEADSESGTLVAGTRYPDPTLAQLETFRRYWERHSRHGKDMEADSPSRFRLD